MDSSNVELSNVGLNNVGTSNYINNIIDEIQNDIIIDFNNTKSCEHITIKEKTIDKITTNLYIIKHLYNNNIFYYDEKHINKIDTSLYNNFQNLRDLISSKNLNSLVTKNINEYVKYYKKIRQKLGHIICDIYKCSDYHILMANIPSFAIPIANNNIDNIDNMEPVNSEVILETLEHYNGLSTIDNVFQVSPSNYLVKFKSYDDCKKICVILNKMQISDKIIKVELLVKKEKEIATEIAKGKEIVESEIVEPEPIASEETDESQVDINKTIFDFDKINIINDGYFINDSYVMEDIIKPDDKQEVTKESNLLIVNLAYGIYSKITNIFSYFRK